MEPLKPGLVPLSPHIQHLRGGKPTCVVVPFRIRLQRIQTPLDAFESLLLQRWERSGAWDGVGIVGEKRRLDKRVHLRQVTRNRLGVAF